MPDVMKLTVLPDGTIKSETDRVSTPNHMSAEAFLREVARLAGGKVDIKHRHGQHGHSQSHDHSHGEEHHH